MMNKTQRSIIVIISLIALITGCKSQSVKKCESYINDIGIVTIDSRQDIDQAVDMYENLSSAEQKQVSNYENLQCAEVQYVELLIDNIGNVNLDSDDSIIEAREAYDKLDSSLQDEVSNFNTLEDSEKEIEFLDITGSWTGMLFDSIEVTYVFNDDGTMYNYSSIEGVDGTANGTYSFDGSTITLGNGQSLPAERKDDNTLVITAVADDVSLEIVLTRKD